MRRLRRGQHLPLLPRQACPPDGSGKGSISGLHSAHRAASGSSGDRHGPSQPGGGGAGGSPLLPGRPPPGRRGLLGEKAPGGSAPVLQRDQAWPHERNEPGDRLHPERAAPRPGLPPHRRRTRRQAPSGCVLRAGRAVGVGGRRCFARHRRALRLRNRPEPHGGDGSPRRACEWSPVWSARVTRSPSGSSRRVNSSAPSGRQKKKPCASGHP